MDVVNAEEVISDRTRNCYSVYTSHAAVSDASTLAHCGAASFNSHILYSSNLVLHCKPESLQHSSQLKTRMDPKTTAYVHLKGFLPHFLQVAMLRTS